MSDILVKIYAIAPIFLAALYIILGVEVSNSDALTYHVYLARYLSENNGWLYSSRPIEIANELGIGISGYFPWLYSNLVSCLKKLFILSYSDAAWVVSTGIYICVMATLTNPGKMVVATYLMLPVISTSLYLSGTNYLLVASLSYFLYVLYEKQSESFWQKTLLILVAAALIESHVLGLYLFIIITGWWALQYKSLRLVFFILLLTALRLYENFLLTGSPTFPLFQSYLPHRNFNYLEWSIIQDEIARSISWEWGRSSSLKKLGYFTVLIITFGAIHYTQRKKSEKFFLTILLIPTLFVETLGFRHRVILITIIVFIISHDLNWPLRMGHGIKKYVTFAIFTVGVLLFIVNLKKIESDDQKKITHVKKCFYSVISGLSSKGNVLLPETELLNIKNPKNIIAADGSFNSATATISDHNEFLVFLKQNRIDYITHTPLGTQTTPFHIKLDYIKHIDKLMHNGSITIVQDCLEPYGRSEILNGSFVDNDPILSNWIVFQVN